jgi:hypothetical protein
MGSLGSVDAHRVIIHSTERPARFTRGFRLHIFGGLFLNTRILVVLPENHPIGHSIAAQIADAVDCSVFTAYGIRAALSLIAREKPDIAIFEDQFATVEGRHISELIAPISPETEVVFVNVTRFIARDTAAGSE